MTLKMDIHSLIDSNIHLAIYCGMSAMQEISSVELASIAIVALRRQVVGYHV